jgi:RNA polymerase sigma-70 factor (ECF subfamily)
MRWELNDLCRRLDEKPVPVAIDEGEVPAPPPTTTSTLTPVHRSVLEAINNLPEDEREVFELVRVQGLTQSEAAEVAGISTKTVQRRLNRALVLLWKDLEHIRPTA